jgi:hypothetical protein
MMAYSDALGGDARLTEGQRADVRKAAGLVVLAEDLRELALQEGPGSPGALSALVRLESSAARAVRALRLPAPGRSKSALRYGRAEPVPSLQDYLISKQAEDE